MTVLRLIRIDFDNLENRNSRKEQTLGVFLEGGLNTAQGNASEWLSAQEPTDLYLGHDRQVYPQFKLIEETVLKGI